MASFLSSPSSGSLPSVEAYRRVPVTRPQRLTSEAPMSDPRWRETRPSRPYGGEPGDRPPRRVPGPPPTAGRVPGRPPGAVPPRIPPGASRAPRREAGRGVPDPRDSGPRGRDAGREGRAPDGRGGGGPDGRGGGGRGVADGPPTRRMPAQPDEPQPART